MYRILLTDDEYLIVDGLFEYLYGRRGDVFEIIKTYSAHEALAVMERMRVDILVTDIEMPVMNGISFHKIFSQKWPEIRTVFLTAHSNFDYAYYASHFPNTKFILKSDGFAALLSLLDELSEEISHELFTRHLLSSKAGEYGSQIVSAQMSMMRGLLTAPPEASQQLQQKLDAWYVPLSAEKKIVPVLLRVHESEAVLQYLSLCDRFCEEFSKNSSVYPICLDEQNIFFLFQQTNETVLCYPDYLREMLDLYLLPMEKMLNSPVFLAVCRESVSWDRLGNLYQKIVKTALRYENIQESVLCTVGVVGDQTAEPVSGSQNVNEATLTRIDTFLAEHFHEDISLSDIAAHVYLSPAYVSSLYKKNRGINVIDRLQQIRISESKILLSQTNLKIQDIAQKCGFRSSRYFIAVFRKLIGVNPGKYRDQSCAP